jgi:protein CWC15
MSTAHRPTWAAALGGSGLRDGASSAQTQQYSSKDMPSHTKLKYRKFGQCAPEELIRKEFPDTSKEAVALESSELLKNASIDEDTEVDDFQSDSADEIFSFESNEEDETAELMRELDKIKREREEAKLAEAAKAEQEMLISNPLINLTNDSEFNVKRRWDDDVVFKNQAKGVDDKQRKRFINDTTRSDFHRKFIDKYIK